MMRSVLIVLSLMLFAPVVSADEQPSNGFVESARKSISGYIQPSFAAFKTETERLATTMHAFCETPSDDVSKLHGAFKNAVLGFARIEIVRFGALIQENRLERLFFWPDRRGLALKRVQRALAEQDQTVLDSRNLSDKSVAVQGFGALEFLLFGTGSNALTTDKFRCAFAASVTQNIVDIASELDEAWQSETGFVTIFTKPGEKNPAYRTPKEIGAQLLATLRNGAEGIEVLKLNAVLGKEALRAKPKRSPFWRSGLTLEVLKANIQGLQQFEEQSGLLQKLPEDGAWLKDATAFEYRQALARLDALEAKPLDAFSKEKPRAVLEYAAVVMAGLRRLYDEEIGPALGLKAGFNALDGD